MNIDLRATGLTHKGFQLHGKITPTSWEPDGNLTYEQWEQDGHVLQRLEGSMNWIIGDWLNYGERKYGEMYAQAIEWTGNKLQYLKDLKWVCGAVKPSSREDGLSYTHHKYVAHLPEPEQRLWLEAATTNEWSSRELQQALAEAGAKRTPLTQPQWTKDEPPAVLEPAQTERTYEAAIDTYEQLAEELAGDDDGYNWTAPNHVTTEDKHQHQETVLASKPPMAVHYSSERHDWETPQELFDLLNQEFGFTLDVCALPDTAKCSAYFTPDDDGLTQDWSKGICWMNPPYGDEIVEWVTKAHEESRKGGTVVCLIPARVDTAWWWDNCIHGEIRFLKGRLKFKQNGNEESSAPFPSAVIVFSPIHKPGTIWWDWKRNIRF